MRIGIDGHFLGSGTGGNETLTESLLRALLDVAPQHTFVTIHTSGDFDPGELASRGNAEFHLLRPNNALWRQLYGLGAAARRLNIDVLLCQYWAPFFFPGELQVQVILDVGHRYHPEHFTMRQRLQLDASVLSGARRVGRILTISDYSKQTITEAYGIDRDRVGVVRLGVDTGRFRPASEEAVKATRERLRLPREYLLYVGNLMPRKNITGLIRAFEILKSEHRIPHSLLIVGRRRWMTGEIFRCAERSGVSREIVFTGYASADDLPAIYTGAALHVLPSFFEGFGITLLESMACGTPVAASNTTSIPEVVGDAGLLFDPGDFADMAGKMVDLIEDDGLRRSLVEKGYQQVKRFTWEQSARKTLQALEQVGSCPR